MRVWGNLNSLALLEELLSALLEREGVNVAQDRSAPFSAFGANNIRSPVYKRSWVIRGLVFNYWYDERAQEDRKVGIGHLTVNTDGVKELIARLRDRGNGEAQETAELAERR